MTRKELHLKDKVISPLITQGQSPYHILTNHPELGMSVRTMYSYLDQGLFPARNIDLKRKIRFKPRKCHKSQTGQFFPIDYTVTSVAWNFPHMSKWIPSIPQES